MKTNTKLLLVGCGKMGTALLQCAVSEKLAESIVVVEPASPPAFLKVMPHVTWLSEPDKIPPSFNPDIIILAIKPQQMEKVLPLYARFKDSVFMSIAAGTTITKLASLLQSTTHSIVRAMPNLPASIGEGMSVAVANKNVTAEQKALCDMFLTAIGESVWTEDENLMDAVTALSGSGPAYVFALCEAMTKAGEALGLPAPMAARLAHQTVIGSGALMAQSPETAEALRIAVTSPGGTTEAALKHLLDTNGLQDLMHKAMHAAAQRAQELSGDAQKQK